MGSTSANEWLGQGRGVGLSDLDPYRNEPPYPFLEGAKDTVRTK